MHHEPTCEQYKLIESWDRELTAMGRVQQMQAKAILLEQINRSLEIIERSSLPNDYLSLSARRILLEAIVMLFTESGTCEGEQQDATK